MAPQNKYQYGTTYQYAAMVWREINRVKRGTLVRINRAFLNYESGSPYGGHETAQQYVGVTTYVTEVRLDGCVQLQTTSNFRWPFFVLELLPPEDI